MRRMTMVVRTGTAPEAMAETTRRHLRALSGEVAIVRTRTLRVHVQEALAGERLTASLLSVCGLLALVLAVVGLYGAIAYPVTRRTREIGVLAAYVPARRAVRIAPARALSRD